MREEKAKQLSTIKSELLQNKDLNSKVVYDSVKLALEDDYLFDLMVDYKNEANSSIKKEMLHEIVNYTEEMVRKLKLGNK